jgi:hypothetical protein
MGCSDPFPAGFKIRFGSLNFQATGNGYLMHLTNRDELHPWRSIGPGRCPPRLRRTLQHPPGGYCEHLDSLAPQVLMPTLAPRAHGATPGRTRRDMKGRAHRRSNTARGGACGRRVAVALRDLQCRRDVHLIRQHRHGRVRGSPRPPPAGGPEPRRYHQ